MKPRAMTEPAKKVSTPDVPSVGELLSATHEQFAAWCQGRMAYTHGDVLAAAAVCRADKDRARIARLTAEMDALRDNYKALALAFDELDKLGFIQAFDAEDDDVCDHWKFIARQAIDAARKAAATPPAP